MVPEKTINIIREYLEDIHTKGIILSKVFIFGGVVHGTMNEESDIDLMLISPLFDNGPEPYVSILWGSKNRMKYRIEPHAVGEKKFNTNDSSPLIAAVKSEGIEIAA